MAAGGRDILCWSYEASRRVDATIGDLRSKGRVLCWTDIKYDDVPDEQNAATHLHPPPRRIPLA